MKEIEQKRESLLEQTESKRSCVGIVGTTAD